MTQKACLLGNRELIPDYRAFHRRRRPDATPSKMMIRFRRFALFLLVTSQFVALAQPEETGQLSMNTRQRTVDPEVERLLGQLTLEEKVSLCHANSKFTIAGVERLGIKEMWMSDGPHGVREEISRDSWSPAGWDNDHATYLPPLTAVAASFNPDMATLHGSVLGAEARERKKDVILGPGVNLSRLPLYGRNFEYMGEDPYLASQLVVPEIVAIQKNDVAACLKHYALNNQELNRHGVNAQPDERTLREIYLPAFEAAVKDLGPLRSSGHSFASKWFSAERITTTRTQHVGRTSCIR
jgi:beta-glucosidase